MALTSCATAITPAGVGALYTDVTSNEYINDNHASLGKKVGYGKATNILGLLATGDVGVNKAARDGGIRKITHIDAQKKSVLGLYATYEIFVYGE